MSTEQNKALVQRLFEAYNKHDLAGVDELFAPDYVIHGTGLFPDMDLADLKQQGAALWTAFPDMHYTLEDLIAEGDGDVLEAPSRLGDGVGRTWGVCA